MKQLLEDMVWCWINYHLAQEFVGKPNSRITHELILAEADKRCLIPLRDAGVIEVWKMSLTSEKGHMILVVDLTLPERAPNEASAF